MPGAAGANQRILVSTARHNFGLPRFARHAGSHQLTRPSHPACFASQHNRIIPVHELSHCIGTQLSATVRDERAKLDLPGVATRRVVKHPFVHECCQPAENIARIDRTVVLSVQGENSQVVPCIYTHNSTSWSRSLTIRMGYRRKIPPSTTMVCPVMKLACSEARNTAMPARSAGSPILLIACRLAASWILGPSGDAS